MRNKLISGENLKEMRKMEDECVDIICTDPPFNSGKKHSSKSGEFNDQWKSMDDYLEFMKPRLISMHGLLKETGSLYLHCDGSASHYLKIELDKIFGSKNFRNDIIWCYNKWSNNSKQFQRNHDSILYYSKGANYTFNPIYGKMSDASKKSRVKGYHIHYGKNYLLVYDRDNPKVQELINSGKFDKIYYEKGNDGVLLSDHWRDISILGSMDKDRTGYPTQKPVKLYQRIIKSSSNPGDLVFDPFAGSGTTIDAAQSLDRRWVGVDQNKSAIETIEKRMTDKYGFTAKWETYYE